MPPFNGPVEVTTVNGNLQVLDDGTGNYGKVIAGPLAAPQPVLAATTGAAGFALQNATLHRVTVFGSLFAASPMTGGAVSLSYTDPGGNANTTTVLGGGFGAGGQAPTSKTIVVKAGTAVTLAQSSALTAGAATVWAELWAS